MLTVWCVFWGDKYSHYYPQRLRREVEKHLTVPHRFLCLSSQNVDGVETVAPISEKPGWWQKIDLFSFKGPALYLDLDTVITGNLDPFTDGTDADIRICKNWAMSGHGGCQSSIMYWRDMSHVLELFDESVIHWPPVSQPGILWGDQEQITVWRDAGDVKVDYFNRDQYKSYKYHCRDGLPADCRAVIFHGKPDPHEVRESWFQW